MSRITESDLTRIRVLQYRAKWYYAADEQQWAVHRLCDAVRAGERVGLRALNALRSIAETREFSVTLPLAFIDERIASM